MTPEQKRIAIAEMNGFTGCVDAQCPYRKAQHLHKAGRCYFPESFSVPMYPDYLNDLNAMWHAEEAAGIEVIKGMRFHLWLICDQMTAHHATAAQHAEAFLRTTGFKL